MEPQKEEGKTYCHICGEWSLTWICKRCWDEPNPEPEEVEQERFGE